MNEEEKKKLRDINFKVINCPDKLKGLIERDEIIYLFKILEKQQAEIEKCKSNVKAKNERLLEYAEELEKKDKIIDLMAISIANNNDIEYEVCDDVHEIQGECDGFAREAHKSCEHCIKQYFNQKIEKGE